MICSFATDAAHNFLCWENHISRHILLQLKIRSAGYPVSNTCFAGGSEQTLRLARLWDLTQEAKSTHFSPVQDAWAVQSHPHTAATESGSASLETSVMPWWTLLVYYHYKAMKTSIWSAYFITTLWEHRVLLRVNLHEATEKRILFYTSICLPHCPPRNCHLRRLPKFYILGQLLLKNKKREGKKKKVFRLWAKQAKSPTCAPSPHGSSKEILRTTSGSRPSWGSCCCSMVAPPSLFAPTEWPRTGIHYLSSGSGWSASVFISAANCLWILWILQLSIYFHNLCPRLRLFIKLFNYQDLPSQRNDNITTQMYPQGIQTAQFLVPTWIPIQVSLRNTEAYSRYHIEQECIFFYTTESWTWLRWTAGKGRNPVIALGRPLKGFKSDQPSFQRCSVDNILA